MTLRVVVRPAASKDIARAHAWYEAQQAGLGKKILDEVEKVFERVVAGPYRFPFIVRDVQRALVRIFPYSIYFRALDDEIRIIGVIHQHRQPGLLKSGHRADNAEAISVRLWELSLVEEAAEVYERRGLFERRY